MTAGNWIFCIITCVLSCMVGFGFMFWVAKEMVRKVRAEESQKHIALLSDVAEKDGVWMDIVNDILDAVQMGKLQNKSVPDQSKIVRDIITAAREQKPVETVTLGDE